MNAPRMPDTIHAIIQQEPENHDPEIPGILRWMRDQKAFNQFAHGRDTFYTHLKGTYSMLINWNQASDIARCGLFHSAYTRHGFNFRYFDITNPQDRSKLSSVIGPQAELNVYKYCATDDMWDRRWYVGTTPAEWKAAEKMGALQEGVNWDDPFDDSLILLDGKTPLKSNYTFNSRIRKGETIHMTAAEIAKNLIIFTADLADQQSDVTSYASVYQKEDAATRLWPGTGIPGMVNGVIGTSFFTRLLIVARPHLDHIPLLFNSCT